MSEWPPEAVDFVQAIADTKLVLSQRYAERMLSGPVLEDDIAGASAAQDEIGHVRQLFRLLGAQGREDAWLEGEERSPEEVANASTLDERPESWLSFVVRMDLTERAAWYLLDAIDDEDFEGLSERIGQDEYFHLEHLDARVENLAAEKPEEVEEALADALPGVLAFLGPASHDEESDPLVAAGFTDRSIAALRDAYRERYEAIFEGSDVSVSTLEWDAPEEAEWDATRRRVGGGSIPQGTLDQLSGIDSKEFAAQ